jgi:hypothetical protein
MLVQINIVFNRHKFPLLVLIPFISYLLYSSNYFCKVQNLFNLSEQQTQFAYFGEEMPQPFNTNLDKSTKESLDNNTEPIRIVKEKIIKTDFQTTKYYLSFLCFDQNEIQLLFLQATLNLSIPRSPPSANC